MPPQSSGGQALAPARQTGCLKGRVHWQCLLHENLMLPTIAEVVLVNELLLRHRREVSHGVLLLVQRLGAEVVPLTVGYAIKHPARYKLAQMGVRPTHRGLDDTVQPVELHIRPHNDSSTDGRLAVTERDFQLVERRRAAGVG